MRRESLVLAGLGIGLILLFTLVRSRSTFLGVEADPAVAALASELEVPFADLAALQVLLGGQTPPAELRARADHLRAGRAATWRLGVAAAAGYAQEVAAALARTGDGPAAERLLQATAAGDAWRAHAELSIRFAGRRQ